MRDVTGARTLGTAIAGVVGCGESPVPLCVDEWYEQGGRGGINVVVVPVAHR
jgi:hypothetical protein